jgi:transposase
MSTPDARSEQSTATTWSARMVGPCAEATARLEEIAQLGRTLWRRRADILAFFAHHASNGPIEALQRLI